MFFGVPVKNPHDDGGDEIGCQDADPHWVFQHRQEFEKGCGDLNKVMEAL